MSNVESVVAVYQTHSQAEDAVKELQRAGIDMCTLSIVAKDYHTDDQVVGYYNAGDRMKRWGKAGAYWEGFGDCCSAQPSLRFQVSGRCSWQGLWSRGLWARWKARLWSAV